MKERPAKSESLSKPITEKANTVIYYTVKGKQDAFDDGFPVQDKETLETCAKKSGTRLQIRIDDRGNLVNPCGLYNDKQKLDRWVPAPKSAFSSYLQFLRTKNQMFYRQAERAMR
jgi:hypothetical protein